LEEPIRTIYQPGNPTSHFNPLLDSMRIYFVLLRSVGVSMLTALIDNVVFVILFSYTGNKLWSQVIGRGCAMFVNFTGLKRVVFHSPGRARREFLQYCALGVVSGTASYLMIALLTSQF